MEHEDVLIVIDKLTDANVTLQELNEIKPLIGTTDFTETYEIVAAMEIALQEEGRLALKKEMEEASKEYLEEVKGVKIRQFNRWLLPSIAAVLHIPFKLTTKFRSKLTTSFAGEKCWSKSVVGG